MHKKVHFYGSGPSPRCSTTPRRTSVCSDEQRKQELFLWLDGNLSSTALTLSRCKTSLHSCGKSKATNSGTLHPLSCEGRSCNMRASNPLPCDPNLQSRNIWKPQRGGQKSPSAFRSRTG
uniref:Uncharacterized protein n=1 Tax=Micrurus corallinus TaxID=54390 RepID=A0A2D4FYB2_MICCO